MLSGMLVYPNPAASFVNVKVPGHFSLRLLDVTGGLVVSKDELYGQCELDVSMLSGIFILEVNNKKENFIKKLIIQK